jgi:hypothetical protein
MRERPYARNANFSNSNNLNHAHSTKIVQVTPLKPILLTSASISLIFWMVSHFSGTWSYMFLQVAVAAAAPATAAVAAVVATAVAAAVAAALAVAAAADGGCGGDSVLSQ